MAICDLCKQNKKNLTPVVIHRSKGSGLLGFLKKIKKYAHVCDDCKDEINNANSK